MQSDRREDRSQPAPPTAPRTPAQGLPPRPPAAGTSTLRWHGASPDARHETRLVADQSVIAGG